MKLKFLEFVLNLLHDNRGSLDLTGGESGAATSNEGGDSGLPTDGASGGSGDLTGGDLSNGEPSELSLLFDGLEDDVRNDPSLKVFLQENKLNVANLAKSYVHAQRKVGEKGVRIPDNNATDEEWKDFYNKVRPSELDKYEIKNTLGKDAALDEELFSEFKKNAHGLGLTTKQAQSLVDWFNQSANNAQALQTKAQQDSYEKEANALRSSWGEGFQKEMALATRAFKEFADENDIQYLKDKGLASDPRLIKLFNKIGHGLMEDKFDKESHGSFGFTKDEIGRKIDDIRGDMNGPFWNSDHPNHKRTVEEVNKLHQMMSQY